MVQVVEAKGDNGQVSFDGRSVTITRKGFVARTSVGRGTKSIPVGSISAVQWKPAGVVTRGFIQFTLSGGNERRSRFGSQNRDAWTDENSVSFSRPRMQQFEALREAVEVAIVSPTTGSASSTASVADELAKLAQLRDAGVLKPEEFEAQKARLLGSGGG